MPGAVLRRPRRRPGLPTAAEILADRAELAMGGYVTAPGQQTAPPASLAEQLTAITAAGRWFGSLSELAGLVRWPHEINALVRKLAAIQPDLQTRGVTCHRTGERTGPSRRSEWIVSRKTTSAPEPAGSR